MKPSYIQLAVSIFAASIITCTATVRYVDVNNSNPATPYTTWATAARVIQDAVDAAVSGDEIIVTNGTYAGVWIWDDNYGASRVLVNKAIVLRSVNGPQHTIIQGSMPPHTSIRCVYLANGASLAGFTLTNGCEEYGGGLRCESVSAVASNCVLVGNSCEDSGGGVHFGTLNNCTLTRNSAAIGGAVSGCTLNNCTLTDNSATSGGGAIWSTLNNCTLTDNYARKDAGGAHGSTLNNCALTDNHAEGTGGASRGSTLNNCTVTGNSAEEGCGGTYDCRLTNCLVYFNTSPTAPNYSNSSLIYCCTTPAAPGAGNIAVDPQLASATHLSVNSPCRGAGNPAYARGVDLDSEVWAVPPSIGCDEYHPGSQTGGLSVEIVLDCTNGVPVGYPIHFTAVIGGHASASAWDFGDGVAVANQPFTTHAYATTGDYSVTLRVYNESHPEGVSATAKVRVSGVFHYVDAASMSPEAPYTSWSTAARTIQAAVDVAVGGDEIIVTNGTYATGGRAVRGVTTNRVAVEKPMVVRSVNGPEVTIIQGRQVAGTTNGVGAVRCAYLATGASLSGFTLTGGATETRDKEGSDELASGGGVWCETAVVTNCIIVGNAADISGGGCFRGTITDCAFSNNTVGSAYGTGGGAAFASLISCLITSNSAFGGGGAYSGVLTNCTLIGNAAVAGGGGSYATLINCFMMSNSATSYGGGNYGGALTNCTLIGNAAKRGGGAASSDLSNCLVISNTAAHDETYGYGFGGGALSGRLYNCTLVGNEGSGAYGEWGGHFCCTCILYNCILSHNSCDDSVQWADLSVFAFANDCFVAGDPRFVDEAAGDLRLRSDSPCINAGRNDYAPAGTDFDGNPRIVGGAVDIGAFEFQSPQSTLPYWWLQQYALPTDGSADAADSDGDGHNNGQEWRADTVPTNALSRLALLGVTNAPGRVGVTWQSVATRYYFLERATNLSGAHPFMSVQTSIPGQAGTTSFTDTNVSGGGPFFYRVGVQ